MAFNDISVSKKLWGVIGLLIALLLAFEIIAYTSLYRELLDNRKAQVKEQVDSAYSLIAYYESQSDTLGTEKAQQQAMQAVAALRYGNGGYFWINDYQHTLIMHPLKPQLQGKNLTNTQDASGQYHWQAMVNTVKKMARGMSTIPIKVHKSIHLKIRSHM